MVTRILCGSCPWIAAVVLAASPAGSGATGEAGNERLYLLDSSGSILVTYDPVTLERLSLQLTGPAVGMQSLTYGQGRLYSIEYGTGLSADKLIKFHPATGFATAVGPTGISYSNAPSIKYDATHDEFFVLYQENPSLLQWYADLYRIDPAIGQMTYVARIAGGSQNFPFFPLAMAINLTGEAYVSEPSYGTSGPGFGRLDLGSGVVQPLGRVPMGIGNPRDMSFDASGRLWVLFDDWVDNSKDGIYTVDPVALTFEPMLVNPGFPLSGMNSIAVMPMPATSTFCHSSGSTSCRPTLSWNGLPSATADSGFTVSVRGTPSTASGLMLFGNGVPTPPFVGSLLCFAPPYNATSVTPSVSAGTGSPCDGTWSVDLNPLIYLSAVFAPGDTLRAQWIGFDPTARPGERRVTSDALEFDLAP